MKARAKANGNPPRKSAKRQRDQARIVEAMAAKGLSADVIAACLGMDRNTLRSSLHNGRTNLKEQKEAAAGVLTRAEMCAADAILSAINSEWQTPDGNLIWSGLDGDGAKSAADAFAAWQRDGGRFITAGIRKNFSAERIAEFVALKRQAQALLGNG